MFEDLKKYIKEWNYFEGIKPQNDTNFIKMFIDFISKIDDSNDIEFDGDGSYFGKQVSIVYNRHYNCDFYLNFEVAYYKSKISVYSGKHNGFWTPEFIIIDSEHEFFEQLYSQLHKTLLWAFGL